MAPITRSSLHASPATRGQDSWPAPFDSEWQGDVGGESDPGQDDAEGRYPFHEKQDSRMAQAQSFRSTSTQQLLRPLQQTADRVSRQVEEFAKCVDRFSTSLNPAEQEMWENARHLAQKYSTIAVSRQKQASSELTASRSANRSRRGLQAEIEKAGEEIEQSQFEAELWSLLAGLIACDSPRTSSEVDEYQKKALQDLHQYSTADDVWEAFLLSDRFAQQYQEVLAWLQKTAASAKLSINEVTASLRHQAQQGDGIFSAAWLFTKHSIKGQKQSRSWPKPLELDNPGIEISHTRSSDSKPLVTQLDPDTRSRQKQCLEPQDEFHEQASWLACWEMLRRGYNADHFRAHWSEAKEFWRAASTGEVKSASGMDKSSSWTRFASLVSRSEWGKRCYALCRDGTDMDRYQRAVYGLLCGDPHSPIRVCKSVDDILFVCFNTLLIQRYRQFVQAYQSRLDKQDSIAYDSPPSERKQVQECLKYCENVDVIKVERQKPQKMIEAALVSTEYESFLLRQGSALALDAEADGRASSLIAVDPNPPRNESIQAAAQDPDTLRFVAHLQLLLRSLGYLEEAYEHDPEILDNNLAGYIRWLQQEGKMAMIPLYASKLLPDRAARAMGSVLIDVTDPVERDLQVKLMRQYNIDVTNALRMLYHIANADILETWASGSAKYAPVRISEYPAGGEGMVVKVRSGLMGDEIAEAEEVAVRTMEWFRYANRDIWTTTCEAASTFYEIFISRGCLAVARQLAERASLAKLSTSILDVDLSRGDAASAGGDVDMDDVLSVHHAQTINPSRRHRERRRGPSALDGAPKFRQKALFDATATWRQLEQLTNALDSLEKWSELADEVERHKSEGRTSQIRSMKRTLQEALAEVRAAMFPMLEDGFLSVPASESDGEVISFIRNHYLPECVLAYNSVLYFAGHTISRSWLVECMNLAQVVATTQSLTNVFMESGRMRELVTAFAMSSQALLHANQAGGKKGKKDSGFDIWQVKLAKSSTVVERAD